MYAGIDLAALPKNPTGVSLYDGSRFSYSTLYEDDAILNFIYSNRPRVVAIDAPLTLPRGRCCFDDSCCGPAKIRQCDRMLISKGYRVFPPGFSFMKQLTLRGKKLRERLEAAGFHVIEVHPRTSMRILGIKDKRHLGVDGATVHEFDACISALVARSYDTGMSEDVDGTDGVIVIPLAVAPSHPPGS